MRFKFADTNRAFLLRPRKYDTDDAGIDLPTVSTITIPKRGARKIYTNICLEFPLFSKTRRRVLKWLFGVNVTGVSAIIKPRSKYGFQVLAGVVDSGYRGEIIVWVYNNSDEELVIKAGEYFAQLVPILNVDLSPLVAADSLSSTSRGEAGGITHGIW